MQRREFLVRSAALGTAAATGAWARGANASADPAFQISLAGWSLNKRHFREHKMTAEQFPQVAREEFGIGAVEFVNTMMPVPTWGNLRKILKSAETHDVKLLLIMCDAEGNLSSGNEAHRLQAVVNHHKWVDIAQTLGCHSIRVNTGGKAGDEGDIQRCIDSLQRLGEYGAKREVAVICENHGGLSSHPESIVKVMEGCDNEWVGTLPDFGNFPGGVDRYDAIRRMMPYAKAVSAKCHDFGPAGEEIRTDFDRMMRIVLEADYRGYVGIEFEGGRMSEHDGIIAARDLLQKIALKLGSES